MKESLYSELVAADRYRVSHLLHYISTISFSTQKAVCQNCHQLLLPTIALSCISSHEAFDTNNGLVMNEFLS